MRLDVKDGEMILVWHCDWNTADTRLWGPEVWQATPDNFFRKNSFGTAFEQEFGGAVSRVTVDRDTFAEGNEVWRVVRVTDEDILRLQTIAALSEDSLRAVMDKMLEAQTNG